MKWAVWVGSVRKGSYNAAVARALSDLAPTGVTLELSALGGGTAHL